MPTLARLARPSEALADFLLDLFDYLAAHWSEIMSVSPGGRPVVVQPTTDPVTPATLPPGTPATLVYECGLCKRQFEAYPVINGPGYYQAVIDGLCRTAPNPDGPASLQYARKHACDDGRLGVGYVVGMRPAVPAIAAS